MKVRMMLPMTVRCKTCGEFMYKGTKFNCKKEDVVGQDYLGLQIFRFYMRCRKCSAEITYLTDPQNLDYKVEHGATRNFEQWKQEQSIEEALKERREAEDEDKVKRLENKTEDAKREMDMMEVLDDMLHTKGQHAGISTEAAIAALQTRAAEDARAAGQQSSDLTPADEAALEQMVAAGAFTRRLDEDEFDGASNGAAPAQTKRPTAVKVQKVVKKAAPAPAVLSAANPAAPQPPSAPGALTAATSDPKSAQPGLGLAAYGATSSSEDGTSGDKA